jgi:hypothetical protein
VQIQEGATAAIVGIREFASTNAQLTSQVAILLLALNQKILAFTTQMLPSDVFEIPVDSSLSAASEAIRDF